MKIETRVYSMPEELAVDICKSIGLDPNRVTRMKFEFDAQLGKPLTIELDYLPEYTGGLKESYENKLVSSDVQLDEDEAGYHASET